MDAEEEALYAFELESSGKRWKTDSAEDEPGFEEYEVNAGGKHP